MAPEIEGRLALARHIADAAGKLTLKHFQSNDLEVINKTDGSPLTIADQESERFLRAEIQQHFPEDAIVGEEFGVTDGTTGFRWILDPIDGTKSFVCGVPLYGTMVGVDFGGEALVGCVHMPGLREGIFASQGGGAWHYREGAEPTRARVAEPRSLEQSVFVTTDAEAFHARGAGEAYQKLSSSVKFARTWGDVYGYVLVATGRVDVMIDPELNIWDAAAVKPIIEEAGGRFTDWKGDRRIDGGDAIGSSGGIHDEILQIIQQQSAV